MTHTEANICIIGAGPAGAITSLLLAKKGIKSILVDKSHFPRHKACADCITGNTIRILKEIDPELLYGLEAKAEAINIKGVFAYSSSMSRIKVTFKPLEKDTEDPSCYGIARYDFDNHLVRLAKQSEYITVLENFNIEGVEVKSNKAKITAKGGKIITADIVVVASGSNSRLTESLLKHIEKDTQVAVGIRGHFIGVEVPYPDHCELFLSRKLMPGGAYLTPLPNGIVNFNLVVRMDKLKKRNLDLKKIMQEYISENSLIKKRFENATLVGNIEGSRLRLGIKRRKICGNNFILAGDAAGLIDLMSANGLPQACISAKIAVKHLEVCLKTGNYSEQNLMAYQKEVHKAIDNYLKLSRVVSPFFNFEWVVALFDYCMNFLTKKSAENEGIQELVYSKNVTKSLINPLFYRKLFFGLKNSSST